MVILRLLHQTRRRIDLKHIAHIFLPLALWFALQKASHYNFNDIKNNSEKIKNDRTVERSMEIIALNTVLAVNNCKKKIEEKYIVLTITGKNVKFTVQFFCFHSSEKEPSSARK